MAAADVAAERHLATVAALDLAIALAAMVGSLVALLAVAEAGRAAGQVAILGLVVAFPHLVAGSWLPHRSNAARWLQIVLAALSLPLFPLGTAWGAYVLKTLLGARGRVLFTGDSADTELARPYPSLVALSVAGSLLVVLGATMVLAVAGPAMARARHRPEKPHARAVPTAPDAVAR